jgi:hypothetical protein
VARASASAPAFQSTLLREAATFNGEALPGTAFVPANGTRAAAAAPLPGAAMTASAHPAVAQQDLESLTWGALGMTLATLVREAESPQADPRLLAALSDAVDGRYPHDWSTQQRAEAVARDMVAPLAQALLAAYVGSPTDAANPYASALAAVNGNGRAGGNGHANGTGNGTVYANDYAANGHNGNGGGNGAYAPSGAYVQPRSVSMGASEYAGEYPGEYPTMVQPRKKVRVTRRLMVDGQVAGEQVVETVVPYETDTEATAADLRAKLDSMAATTQDDMPTLQQIPR